MKIKCTVCPHGCALEDEQTGFCRARSNKNGKIVPINYGIVTSLALDPIEKKPLYHFYPKSKIISAGSFGCNLRCPFCQNYSISMSGNENIKSYEYISPKELADIAVKYIPQGNIGIAYTYNEPLVGYEYVLDCAKEAAEKGLKNVVVTNGFSSEETLMKVLPYIDAMNIDLKAFTQEFYKKIKGDIETVKNFIKIASKCCHVEITTLIIPGENDSVEENTSMAKWIASIDNGIPLHLSRFFPRYMMTNKDATEVEHIYKLKENAEKYLKNVYAGNC
jgi:pyruvate formate lyase activating enzyme